MRFILKALVAGCLTLGVTGGAISGPAKTAAGQTGRTVLQMIGGSAEHTTFATMMEASGFARTLEGRGPFTVFAPVNAAFTALHPGMLDEYVSGVDRASLSRFVACHVIPGRVDMAALKRLYAIQGGPYMIGTLGGCYLRVSIRAGAVQLQDERGTAVSVLAPDVGRSNGEVQVIDKVLMPGN